MTPLQQFLIDRKLELLIKEKRATGIVRVAMLAQLQMTDSILLFLASQQTEENMAKLRLTLETQATPVDDIKPRQENQELTESLIELAGDLSKAWQDEVKRAKKEGRSPKDLKFPLNNLPENIKQKSVSTKIYSLRKYGKLPPNVVPKTRTIKNRETNETQEVLYIAWVKNPPKIKSVEE